MHSNRLFILSSQRLKREFYKHYIKNNNFKNCDIFDYFDFSLNQSNDLRPSFLPKTMSMKEFLDFIIFYNNKKILPKEVQNVFLLNAIRNVKSHKKINTNFLAFNDSFLAFLESSSMLSDLFDELSANDIILDNESIKKISTIDSYDDYLDHLEIILDIFKEYNKILDINGFANFYDRPLIVEDFIKSFDEIHIEISGILSKKEFNIIQAIGNLSNVFLHFKTSQFSNFNIENFLPIKLESNKYYIYNISQNAQNDDKKLLQKNLKSLDINKIHIYKSTSKTDQVNIALDKGQKWIEKINKNPNEYSEDDFALILSDQSFSRTLELYDDFNIFNFAMGLDILDSKAFIIFDAIYKSFKNDDFIMDESNIKIDESIYEDIKIFMQTLQKPFNAHTMEKIIKFCFDAKNTGNDKMHEQVIEEMIETISHFAPLNDITLVNELNFKELFDIVYLKIQKIKIADVKSGKIKAIGTLEACGLHFKEILIIDFNESVILQINNNDFFINSKIRQALHLPTLKDKENLQRHHYYSIFNSCQKVHISFIDSELEMPSIFLKQLGIDTNKAENINDNLSFYDENFARKNIICDEKFDSYDFSGELSASALKSYDKCKRYFYYRYVKHIYPEEMDLNKKAGIRIHYLLFKAYENYQNKILKTSDIEEVKKRFRDLLKNNDDIDMRDYIKLQNFNINQFFDNEIMRVENNEIKIIALEKSFSGIKDGIKYNARIDRIEMCNNEIYIIDYKNSAKNIYKIDKNAIQGGCYMMILEDEFKDYDMKFVYYDLSEAKFNAPKTIIQKSEILNVVKEIGTSTEKIQKKNCAGCAFSILCWNEVIKEYEY